MARPFGSFKYPWATWFNGREHYLRRGIDFDRSAKTIRANAVYAAKRFGVRVQTSIEGDDAIFIQAVSEGVTSG